MSSRYESDGGDENERWVEMEYVWFFDRYAACLPAEEAKLRHAVDEYDRLGLRPVPFRRLGLR